MIILDTLLVGGVKFILSKIVQVVDAELNDESHLREKLLAAQMRLELGEMSPEEFAELERAVLARLRQIREESTGAAAAATDMKVTGVEARAWDEE